MTGRGVPTFALGAVLLLLLAGVGVMAFGAVASPSPDAISHVDEHALVRVASASPDSITVYLPVEEQYKIYEELSTYTSTKPRFEESSRSDRGSESATDQESDRPSENRFHRWECPICGATKVSFSAATEDPDEVAANNLRSHVRASEGHGHGPHGTLPIGLTGEIVHAHVTILTIAD